MLIDIHTHNVEKKEGVISIVNAGGEIDGDGYFSVGIHPWETTSALLNANLADICSKMQDNRAVAIGEIGLDKTRGAELSFQTEIFTTQIRLANRVKKPLIIHCVKAYNELIALRDLMATPAIIHGFRGKPQLANSLLQHGFYISFGDMFNMETVATIPSGSFFIETDTGNDIKQTYDKIATTRGITTKTLEAEIHKTFKKIFPNIN